MEDILILVDEFLVDWEKNGVVQFLSQPLVEDFIVNSNRVARTLHGIGIEGKSLATSLGLFHGTILHANDSSSSGTDPSCTRDDSPPSP